MSTKSSTSLIVVWVYDGSLLSAMDSATWLRIVEELRQAGWQVILLAAGQEGYQNIHGVEVYCLKRPNIYFFRQAIFHLKILHFIIMLFSNIDIIIFHEISAPWILPLRIVRQLIRKHRPLLVMDTRSMPMPSPDNETWRDKVRKKLYKIVIQLGNRFADGRLAITQRMADAVQIPSNKLWGIWPSGADKIYFSKEQPDKHWPGEKGTINLIYHGSMHYERNLMTLCKAVMKANAEGLSFKLTLVGDGSERKKLEEYANQSNNLIEVICTVPPEQIPGFLAKAHIGILPFPDEQKFRVSSPIKLFEYMAAGLPILATRIVCHTDVVEGGDFVFWAENSNEQGLLRALYSAWNYRKKLSEMGKRASNAAENWTWTISARKLMGALETGIEKAGKSSPHFALTENSPSTKANRR